jgi:Probable sensor domain DACNV
MKDFPLTSDSELVAEVTARVKQDSVAFDSAPDAGQICGVLNTAFWASMQSEEGRSVRASLVLMDPEYALGDVFRLSDPIGLSSHTIAKLSASFPFRPGAIGITFPPQRHPLIWGFVLPKREYGWLVEMLGPGFIVVRREFYVEAALLPDGSRILFNERTDPQDAWHSLLSQQTHHTSVGRQIPFAFRAQFYGFLQILARAMIDHRRGGSVVLVSAEDEAWKGAIDFKYEFSKPEEYVSSLVSDLRKWQKRWTRSRDRKRKEPKRPTEIDFYPDSRQEQKLHQALRLVGGLTAVDGTMVMTTDLKILGYGAKLKPTARKRLEVREWFPFRDDPEEPKSLQDIGGTRHQSAAQFVSQYPETVILVASQDGRFTIFCCDAAENEVLALRAELLFL